jgi:hypothetical protein
VVYVSLASLSELDAVRREVGPGLIAERLRPWLEKLPAELRRDELEARSGVKTGDFVRKALGPVSIGLGALQPERLRVSWHLPLLLRAEVLDLAMFAKVEAAMRKRLPQLDWSTLPRLNELAAHLEPEAMTVRYAKGQWRIQSYSPTGGTMGAAMTGIVAAVAIPSMLRARMSANEAASSGALETLAAAQTDYHDNSTPRTFADSLQQLQTGEGVGNVRYIDDRLASGVIEGYEISMAAGFPMCNGVESTDVALDKADARNWDPAFIDQVRKKCVEAGGKLVFLAWRAEAHPIVYQRTGVRSFYLDKTGILLGADNGGKPGTAGMPEL